jgi:hypothetical protein
MRPVSVVAYADDVTVFLTSASDISTVEDVIRQFEKAPGARLNPHKSRALIGRWSVPDNPLGIAYHPSARILGFQFWSIKFGRRSGVILYSRGDHNAAGASCL